MEISQIGLFLLLVHSAVGGAFLGAFCEMLCTVRFFVKVILLPESDDEHEESNADGKQPGSSKGSSVFRVILFFITVITDVIFMIASALMLIIIAYACNSGRMRWMLVLGMSVGFFAYRLTVGRLTRRIFSATILFLKKIIAGFVKATLAPLKKLKIKKKNKCILSKKVGTKT